MAEALTQEEVKVLNAELFEKLSSNNDSQIKMAADAVTAFTRTKMREDGFFRRVMPMVPVQNDQLTRQVEDEKPMVVVDKEPDSPAAITIGFATLPQNLYIRADRYPVKFARIATSKFTKDVDDLRTWIMDVRMVISDNSIKDMLAEEDGRWINACNAAVCGKGLTVATSGVVQYEGIAGGITRDSLWDSMRVLP